MENNSLYNNKLRMQKFKFKDFVNIIDFINILLFLCK